MSETLPKSLAKTSTFLRLSGWLVPRRRHAQVPTHRTVTGPPQERACKIPTHLGGQVFLKCRRQSVPSFSTHT